MVEEVGKKDGRVEPDWGAVEADYLGRDLNVEQILVKHGITKQKLSAERRDRGWRARRNAPLKRSGLIERLMRLVDHQISQLEREHMGAGDKEVALVGNLTRTLERLLELKDKKPGTETGPVASDAEIREMREALITRMRELEKS